MCMQTHYTALKKQQHGYAIVPGALQQKPGYCGMLTLVQFAQIKIYFIQSEQPGFQCSMYYILTPKTVMLMYM